MTDRRSFLRGASVLMGHAAFGQVMTSFAATPRMATFFAEPKMLTLRALVDVILPATDSPAASAADTHYFIDIAMPVCASSVARNTFREGLSSLGKVLNAHNQIHAVPNVFVTDGSCMVSSPTQNPSLTYMALTARAARHAVDQLKRGAL